MALEPLVPSRHSFFDSFQSSFSKFNGTQINFLRYGSSTPFKKQTFYSTNITISSSKIIVQVPHGKSKFLIARKPISRYNYSRNLSSGWIDKWNESQKHNRPKPPKAMLNYQSSDNISSDINDGGDTSGGSTMDRIVEKLRKFGYISSDSERKENGQEREKTIEKGSVEDIFYVEEGMLPNSRGGFSEESTLGLELVFGGNGEVRFPWEKRKEKVEEEEGRSERRKSRTCLAELTLPESELRRLRNLTFQKKHKMKIGGAGVTQEVVDRIHEKWKTEEIVRLKIEGPPALNMKRMHEILERKTGGLVIWRSGTTVSLYRGVRYEMPAPKMNKWIYKKTDTSSVPKNNDETMIVPSKLGYYNNNTEKPQPKAETNTEDRNDEEQVPGVKYEDEVDKLLDSLGPRYADWPGCDPLPVDADMLPGTVPGYESPFRILPYGVRATLGVREATALRRLARVLPPHFALGRNRQLQGLAVAMVKLWERSSIAKIALKRGVQLTTSERMAEDIKKLTGGALLSRNKDFLVFYRGKNFLSPEVTEALLERERLAKSLQDEEEHARLRASALVIPNVQKTKHSGTAGTLGETVDADAKWGKTLDDRLKQKVMKEAEIIRHAGLVRKLEHKLDFAERKLKRAERALSKVEGYLKPAEWQADPESITEEERFMFRKLGLRMKAFLLLGRRGVFDGTVENMHLHWKYRELVKIMIKANSFDQVKKIALALEAESGGVLVSVDKVSKAYAIIVYRGQDYKRPSMLRPKNLLTKRKALARSIELQRHEALSNHISALQIKVEKLRSEIEQMEIVKDQGDEALYDKLDSTYATDDDSEEDGDGAYLEAYDKDMDRKEESRLTTCDNFWVTNFPYDNPDQEFETENGEAERHVHAVPYASYIGAQEVEEGDT